MRLQRRENCRPRLSAPFCPRASKLPRSPSRARRLRLHDPLFRPRSNPGNLSLAANSMDGGGNAPVSTTREFVPAFIGGLTEVNSAGRRSRLVVTGANTYCGVTTASTGFFQITNSLALGTPAAEGGDDRQPGRRAGTEQRVDRRRAPAACDQQLPGRALRHAGPVHHGRPRSTTCSAPASCASWAASGWTGNVDLQHGCTHHLHRGRCGEQLRHRRGGLWREQRQHRPRQSPRQGRCRLARAAGASSADVAGYGSNPATPYTGNTVVNAGTLLLN